MKNKLIIGTSICLLNAVGLLSALFDLSSKSQAKKPNQQADIPAVKKAIAQSITTLPVDQILSQLKSKMQVPIFLPSQVSFSRKVYFYAQGKADGYTIPKTHP